MLRRKKKGQRSERVGGERADPKRLAVDWLEPENDKVTRRPHSNQGYTTFMLNARRNRNPSGRAIARV